MAHGETPGSERMETSADIAAAIGNKLHRWRLASDLTADEVARRLGTCRASLYRFEEGNIPKLQAIEQIARLMGLSLIGLLREVIPA